MIAVNQTASPIVLTKLGAGAVLPASGTLILSDFCYTFEIQNDVQLRALVTSGDVVLNDGIDDLNQAESLQFLVAVATTVDLQKPASGTNPGYMPAALALKIEGVETGATNTPLATVNPVNVTVAAAQIGTSGSAARQDHKHNIETGSPIDVSTSNEPGSGTGVALANHQHNLSFSTTASILGNGVSENYVFKANGSDSGSMGVNDQIITQHRTVGTAGDVNFNGIKAGLDWIVANGSPSASTPWVLSVYPGNYTEAPMTVPAGIRIMAVASTDRTDTVLVTASNASEDLFTMTGGSYLGGLELQGVTDATKCLVRCATASSLTILHGVAYRGCSNGLVVSNGASCICTNPAINIDGVGIGVTTGLTVTGSGSYLGISGGFFSVPSAVLPAYATNPVQTVFRVADSARFTIVGATASVAYKTNDATVLYADGGSSCTVMSCEVRDSGIGTYIGSSGTGTTIVAQAGVWVGNYLNGKSDSATGVFLVSASSGSLGFQAVPGTVLSGLIQVISEAYTYIAGNAGYQFVTQKVCDFQSFFHDQTSTGLNWGGEVTAATGLNVDVAAGDGWISRHTPYHDSWNVEWDAETDVALTASATNYIVYDSASDAIIAQTGAPSTLQILLATVVTDATSIRFLHQTRNLVHDQQHLLNNYLIQTRKIAWTSGLAVVEGSTATQFDVSTGAWYRGLDTINVTGDTDVTFSYFYGSNGATEVTSQTDLSTTQYDSSGTLTNMTSGYFRADTLIVTSDGRFSVIYGTAEFATSVLAQDTANKATIPTFMSDTGCYAALIVVEEGVGIDTIVDIRPDPNAATAGGGGGGGSGDHSSLTNLDKPTDHTWAFLVDGTRAMSGDIDMGGNDIGNVATVDGVNVSAHASRHAPGNSDPLSTAVPDAVLVGATAAEGTNSSFSRSDHQHGIGTGTPGAVGQANAAGTSSSAPRLDHTHAGLGRGNNDWIPFTEKTSLTNEDILILEDSAASFAKRRVKVSNLPGALSTLAVTQARRTTTLTMATTWQTLSFDTTDVQTDSGIVEHETSINPSRITVKEAGTYEVKYQFEVAPTSTGEFDGRVLKNGATVIPGSNQGSITYTNESDIISISTQTVLAVNDYLEVQNQLTTAGTMATNATFSVLKLDGATGPTGSGSTLIIRSGGTNVTDTPHSALNFATPDFTVTNDGSGQATVSLAAVSTTDVKMFDVSKATSQTLTATATNVTFNATPNVTHAATFSWDGIDEVTILQAGYVSVSAGTTVQQTAGNGRSTSAIRLDYQPNAGVYATQTVRSMYTRNSTDGAYSSTQLTKNFQVAVGDKFRIQALVTTTGTVVLLANMTDFSLTWAPS